MNNQDNMEIRVIKTKEFKDALGDTAVFKAYGDGSISMSVYDPTLDRSIGFAWDNDALPELIRFLQEI